MNVPADCRRWRSLSTAIVSRWWRSAPRRSSGARDDGGGAVRAPLQRQVGRLDGEREAALVVLGRHPDGERPVAEVADGDDEARAPPVAGGLRAQPGLEALERGDHDRGRRARLAVPAARPRDDLDGPGARLGLRRLRRVHADVEGLLVAAALRAERHQVQRGWRDRPPRRVEALDREVERVDDAALVEQAAGEPGAPAGVDAQDRVLARRPAPVGMGQREADILARRRAVEAQHGGRRVGRDRARGPCHVWGPDPGGGRRAARGIAGRACQLWGRDPGDPGDLGGRVGLVPAQVRAALPAEVVVVRRRLLAGAADHCRPTLLRPVVAGKPGFRVSSGARRGARGPRRPPPCRSRGAGRP
jgi:hypothetical protein